MLDGMQGWLWRCRQSMIHAKARVPASDIDARLRAALSCAKATLAFRDLFCEPAEDKAWELTEYLDQGMVGPLHLHEWLLTFKLMLACLQSSLISKGARFYVSSRYLHCFNARLLCVSEGSTGT